MYQWHLKWLETLGGWCIGDLGLGNPECAAASGIHMLRLADGYKKEAEISSTRSGSKTSKRASVNS